MYSIRKSSRCLQVLTEERISSLLWTDCVEGISTNVPSALFGRSQRVYALVCLRSPDTLAGPLESEHRVRRHWAWKSNRRHEEQFVQSHLERPLSLELRR